MNDVDYKNKQKQADYRGVSKHGNVVHSKVILTRIFSPFPLSDLPSVGCYPIATWQNSAAREKNLIY